VVTFRNVPTDGGHHRRKSNSGATLRVRNASPGKFVGQVAIGGIPDRESEGGGQSSAGSSAVGLIRGWLPLSLARRAIIRQSQRGSQRSQVHYRVHRANANQVAFGTNQAQQSDLRPRLEADLDLHNVPAEAWRARACGSQGRSPAEHQCWSSSAGHREATGSSTIALSRVGRRGGCECAAIPAVAAHIRAPRAAYGVRGRLPLDCPRPPP
jgi:hypothetical protein